MAKFEMRNIDNEVIKSGEIKLSESDVLILKFPTDMGMFQVESFFEYFSDGIENRKIIMLRDDMDLIVLKKED
jgi:hypothetical protein